MTDQAEDWDALIFAKTDRVFRSANDCVKLAEWCREHRKILVLVDDGIRLDYFNPEDAKDAFAGAMSKVFLILASVFAEIEVRSPKRLIRLSSPTPPLRDRAACSR